MAFLTGTVVFDRLAQPFLMWLPHFTAPPQLWSQGKSDRSWSAPALWRFGNGRAINGGQDSAGGRSASAERGYAAYRGAMIGSWMETGRFH